LPVGAFTMRSKREEPSPVPGGAIPDVMSMHPRVLPADRKRRLLVLGILLLLSTALGLRLWHERHVFTTPSLSPSDIERRAKEQPENADAQIDWGDLLRQQGRLEEAGQVLAKASQMVPKDARPYTGMALVSLAQHQGVTAIGFVHESLKRDPGNASVWQGLAALSERLRRTDEAIAAYEKLTQLTPNDAMPWRQLGLLYTRQGQIFRGYSKLQRAVTLNPSDVLAQRYLGENAFLQGKFPEAQQAFARVAAVEPEDPVVLSVLAQIGVILDPTPGGLARAEQQATHSLAVKPSGAAHLALGQIHLARHEYNPAIAEFKAALVLDPDLLPAYVSLSQAYSRMGQPDLASKTDRLHEEALARQGHSPESVKR